MGKEKGKKFKRHALFAGDNQEHGVVGLQIPNQEPNVPQWRPHPVDPRYIVAAVDISAQRIQPSIHLFSLTCSSVAVKD